MYRSTRRPSARRVRLEVPLSFPARVVLSGFLILSAGLVFVPASRAAEIAALEAKSMATAKIGAVEKIRGEASAYYKASLRQLVGGGGVLFEDTLRTGDKTRLLVDFVDGSKLSLGDNSELLIDEMIYDPGKKGKGALRLAKGVFRFVTGQINKVPGGQLVLSTPVATIGIRGTDFWGEQTDTRLTMALLDSGELTIATPNGTVTLTQPLSAVTIERGQAPGAVFTLTPAQLQAAAGTVAW